MKSSLGEYVIEIFDKWMKRFFSDPEAVILMVVLALGFLLVMTLSQVFAPVFASIVLAYLLQSSVQALERYKVPRKIALVLVFLIFMGLFVATILIVWPLAWQQFKTLFEELPNMATRLQELIYLLPEKFPEFISRGDVDEMFLSMMQYLRDFGRRVISLSLASIPNVIAILIYLILVPFMVFFFLKDKDAIINWCLALLPRKRNLLTRVWKDVDLQIGNYIRGKVLEMVLVGSVTYVLLAFFHLQYAILLSALVGISVLIPYVGAVVVTIPVVFVALFQYGLTADFYYVVCGYMVIQALDGNLLVPLLFSEAVNLHPIAIIVAILGFGSLWGVVGVFFAIPLATLLKSVFDSWPSTQERTLHTPARMKP